MSALKVGEVLFCTKQRFQKRNDVAEASRNNSVVRVVDDIENIKLNASRVVYAVKTSLLGVSNREKPSVQIVASSLLS